MPNDVSDESPAITSWRVGQNMIYSPMDWTRRCILYFHYSVERNDSYEIFNVRIIQNINTF